MISDTIPRQTEGVGTVRFFLSGDSRKASSRVRGYWISDELKRTGCKTSLVVANSKARLALGLAACRPGDAAVFQKTYSRWHRWSQRFLASIGVTTILDLDDAPSRVQHPRTLRNAHAMMSRAHAVTVGCRALQEYARQYQPNTHLIHSSINLDSYSPAPRLLDDRPVTIGWIGNGAHYRQDLVEIFHPVLTTIADRNRVRFKLVGACGDSDLHRVFQPTEQLDVEIIDQIDWRSSGAVSGVLADFEIGIYPLLDTEFNRFKGGFKALEYMAMGIPVVASPIGATREIIEPGVVGFFAEGQNEWVSTLMALVDDKSLRESMGRHGRELVVSEYSTKKAARSLMKVVSESQTVETL